MNQQDFPAPTEGFVVTHMLIVADIDRSVDFYVDVLAPPDDPDRVDSFMNIRIADAQAIYKEWSEAGATFLTPPQDRGGEIRCYVRDPDGYLIEVGQATGALDSAE